jgi:actin-related protein
MMLTEPPLTPPRHRECLAELMFETFQVPALHIGTQAVLALYGVHALGKIEASVRPLRKRACRLIHGCSLHGAFQLGLCVKCNKRECWRTASGLRRACALLPLVGRLL